MFGAIQQCNNRKQLTQINNLTRLDDDRCAIASRYKQSQQVSTFPLSSHQSDCRMSNVHSSAIENPTILYRVGYGIGDGTVNIDSQLRPQPTNNRCNYRTDQTFQQRPIRSIPFMGRGSGDASLEADLIQKEETRMRRSCSALMEKTLLGQFTPMIKHVRENVQNTQHIIPEDVAAGWIRGGVPSRTYIRDINC